MGPEFKAWPKTPRLFRDCVITEKIDGTNACVIVQPYDEDDELSDWIAIASSANDGAVKLGAQSRNRVIMPDHDNHGFAMWVQANASALAATLGLGYHFGEWWGSGIQRGYGLTGGERRFSLFNVHRYGQLDLSGVPGLGVVPVLFQGPFATNAARMALDTLTLQGSQAAPGFMKPEGVIVYHSAAGQVFKALIEGDDEPKGARA